jgi:hypothetical protein
MVKNPVVPTCATDGATDGGTTYGFPQGTRHPEDRQMARTTTAQRQAKRTQQIALGTFLAGALVSVAANIAASDPTVTAKIVGAWPAVALLLTVHLFQHAQRSFLVKLAILAVAGIAAWASYWHMVEVATTAGETQLTAHLLPATVDAMMYVATVVLTTKAKAPARRRTAARSRKATGNVTPIRRAA